MLQGSQLFLSATAQPSYPFRNSRQFAHGSKLTEVNEVCSSDAFYCCSWWEITSINSVWEHFWKTIVNKPLLLQNKTAGIWNFPCTFYPGKLFLLHYSQQKQEVIGLQLHSFHQGLVTNREITICFYFYTAICSFIYWCSP